MQVILRGSGSRTPGTDTLPRAGIHRILICRSILTLGDSLCLTPLLQALGETWPGAQIDLVSRSPVAEEICGAHFAIGRVVTLPAAPLRHPIRALRALRQVRSVHYDLVIDPGPRSKSSRLLAMLSRKTCSLGFFGPRKRGGTYSADASGAPKFRAMAPVFLLRSALGERPSARPYPRMDVRLSADERQQGRDAVARLLAEQSPEIHGCIGLFADATGDRRFDTAWWHRFVAAFKPGIAEYALVEVVSGGSVRSQFGTGYPCLYSRHPRKLASTLANLSFFVGADCGVLHLARAAGVPTLGIFKKTAPSEWIPYDGSNVAIDARSLTPEQAAGKALGALQSMTATPP